MWGKSDCLAHRLEHAELLGLAGAGDVERGPVVDGGPDPGPPNSGVGAGVEPQHLDRAVALVVVHGDRHVELASPGAEEDRVRGQRADRLHALLSRAADCRLDLLLLLAVAEQAVLAGVGIDAADGDAGVLEPGRTKG